MDIITETYNNIAMAINNSPLPLSAKYLIIKDIYNDLDKAYANYLAAAQANEAPEEVPATALEE